MKNLWTQSPDDLDQPLQDQSWFFFVKRAFLVFCALLAVSPAFAGIKGILVPMIGAPLISTGSSGGGTVDANATVIATTGSDSNPCTVSSPCLTLSKAQSTVESASDKTIYLRAGTYNITSPITLGSSDAGETWSGYPLDAVDSAIVNGNFAMATMFTLTPGANNITFNDLKLENATVSLIFYDQATPLKNIKITNNELCCNSTVGGGDGYTELVKFDNINGVTIKNNYIHNSVGMGIALDAYYSGYLIENILVDSNVIMTVCTADDDCGGIYFVMPDNIGWSGAIGSNITVSNNYIRNLGVAGTNLTHDIYFDEGTNHVVVKGNILGPGNSAGGSPGGYPPGSGMSNMFADGRDNTFENNIVDLGATGTMTAGMWYAAGGHAFTIQGEIWTGNIMISSGSTQQGPYWVANDTVASNYQISNNMYFNYAGGPTPTAANSTCGCGNAFPSDSSPVFANPQISGWTYTIASGSPALGSPLSFPQIVGGWGPPGFTIPETGTSPSPLY